ncbi:MAG: type I DNA topoisomerase [Chloroflexi bacterium]|nr:MAG: type I DNA topoisomerase [Chloroflexota bacterium]
MAIPLIIVESPAKARTLKRFLGDRYDVRASMGHVRDLPEKELSVDVDRGFLPHYEVVESRRKTIGELRQASGRQKEVILASDPDREGEAIAWHLTEVLRLKTPKRIEFHEITPEAVRRALESPRGLDMQLVNAQQARRILDRLVGYRLSPFLWSKVQKGIGAGRVQSVALRLVVDREEEIRAFIAVESWTLDALLSKPGDDLQFKARLTRRLSEGEKSKVEIGERAGVDAVLSELEGSQYRVLGIEAKRRTKSAPPPYITSTLQQDASSRLRFPPKKTMRLAQNLYEGVELGAGGSTGLITYMRTDSTRVAEDADSRVRGWIRSQLGADYLGRPRTEKSRANAQDAHEAIRPTDPTRRPEDVREFLTSDQHRVYELIWRRFVASRMSDAVYSGNQADIAAGDLVFRASGVVLTFDGFYRVWERDDRDESQLPELEAGQLLELHGLEPEQHFTQPPPRYSEATLIKELEERGIGRPSTYATIVTVIQDHGYVEQRERRLHPTQLGEAVNRIMVDHFKEIVDDKYTADMEERLDQIEQGGEWQPVVGSFYGPLERMLSAAEEAIPAETGQECPECHQGQLILKASRFGPFKGCSRYPKCRYREAVLPSGAAAQPQVLEDKCPDCGRPLQVRKGRYGEFVGCSGYPECNYRVNPKQAGKPRAEAKQLDEACPVCGKPMVLRRGRYGSFKSCSDYPRCKGPKGAGTKAGAARV